MCASDLRPGPGESRSGEGGPDRAGASPGRAGDSQSSVSILMQKISELTSYWKQLLDWTRRETPSRLLGFVVQGAYRLAAVARSRRAPC